MKYEVLINENFTDAYTGKEYVAGDKEVFDETRVNEIRAVKSTLISPLAKVEETPKEPKKTKVKKEVEETPKDKGESDVEKGE